MSKTLSVPSQLTSPKSHSGGHSEVSWYPISSSVRQALDYNSTLRAVGVCVIGYVIQIVVFMIIFSIFGGALPDAPA